MSDRNNCAILFPNFAKKKANHPDLQGSGLIDGVKYKLSAWKKKGARGEFFSIAFTPDKPEPSSDAVIPGNSPSPTGSAECEAPPADEYADAAAQESKPFIA
ncbi:MAG: hypothetical protein KGL39_48515 [Patescibacteria group bacterium]|nr:hypothetical protein [Patescibacteria group bacterium]